MKDNISDMLTRIRNGQKANLLEIKLFWPTPKFCLVILNLLQREGFIRGIKFGIFNKKYCVVVLLKYSELQKPLISKIERISKPGKRIFCSGKVFWNLNTGKGVFLIATSKGLLTDTEARAANVGGEIICYIE